jgi:hypothetical protein
MGTSTKTVVGLLILSAGKGEGLEKGSSWVEKIAYRPIKRTLLWRNTREEK